MHLRQVSVLPASWKGLFTELTTSKVSASAFRFLSHSSCSSLVNKDCNNERGEDKKPMFLHDPIPKVMHK